MNKTPSQTKQPYLLPAETIAAMEELGLVLKAVYLRLKTEGYQWKDGHLIKPTGHASKKQEKGCTAKSD